MSFTCLAYCGNLVVKKLLKIKAGGGIIKGHQGIDYLDLRIGNVQVRGFVTMLKKSVPH